ncbi:hypothetical protein BKA61DRAFT_742769 [Leptodontidium sp. MPI-SDFR-AT-0119]|nr:hypothetical protein BKA61DRAFT_742769 [Leptodontidium sp. MPI-SDFR-AT-0119]
MEARTQSSGHLSVPSPTKPPQDTILEAHSRGVEGQGPAESKRSQQLSLWKQARTTAERRPLINQLLSIDFSQTNYSKEKYREYCKALQDSAEDLKAENAQLRSRYHKKKSHASTTSQTVTGNPLDLGILTVDIPEDEIVVAFSPPDNKLIVLKGKELLSTDSNYVKVTLPSFHWLGTNSLFLYFGDAEPQELSTPLAKPRTFILSRKQLQSTPTQELKEIRTISLRKLGLNITMKWIRGQLQSIYVLAPGPRPAHTPQMVLSSLA